MVSQLRLVGHDGAHVLVRLVKWDSDESVASVGADVKENNETHVTKIGPQTLERHAVVRAAKDIVLHAARPPTARTLIGGARMACKAGVWRSAART